MFFTPLDNTHVLMNHKGGLTTAPLFERKGEVYAKIGKSWHMLTPNGNLRGHRAQWLEFAGDHAERIVTERLTVRLALPAPNVVPMAA